MVEIVFCCIIVPEKERVRGTAVIHVCLVKTIGSYIRDIVDKVMSVITVSEGRHTWKHRVRTLVSSVPETLAEFHFWRKIFCAFETVVEMDLVVMPDFPNAKIFLNRISMVKMIRDEKIAGKVFQKVITRVVET